MPTVKLGIIGCGKITERACIPNLKNYPKVKITHLCDIKLKQAAYLIKKFNLKNIDVTSDWKKIVKNSKIDAVYIATPNFLHTEMCVAAAENKKHILVEKPMVISIKGADKIVKAVNKNRVLFMVEQTQRFDPVHQAAKKVIDNSCLGKIRMIRGRIGHAGPEYWSKTSDWFYNKAKSGGGVMFDIGIHILDLLRWFKPEPISEVFADVKILEKKVDLDDNANVLLRYQDGSIGGFECSWTTRPYEVITSMYGRRGRLNTRIGSENRPVVKFLGSDVRPGKDPNVPIKRILPKIPAGSGWGNAMHYFIDCVVKGKKPFITAEEGRESVRVILAAYKSSREKRWVKLSEVK